MYYILELYIFQANKLRRRVSRGFNWLQNHSRNTWLACFFCFFFFLAVSCVILYMRVFAKLLFLLHYFPFLVINSVFFREKLHTVLELLWWRFVGCVRVTFWRYSKKFRIFLLKDYARQCSNIIGIVYFSVLDKKVWEK